MALRRWRVRRARNGRIQIALPDHEREVVRRMLPQLRELLTVGAEDDRTRRLFPTAFHDDPEAEAEYRRYMHTELVASRLTALDMVEASLDRAELSEEEAAAWLQSVNSVRLVLGTLLDVDEHLDLDDVPDDDPEIQGYAIYSYLSALLDELVQALEH
ncbi:MAG TPA: DUF2017 family protein [Acidimicrobiales bacterium]|nr:DUF2017 family protein [Acidimicrobiales bacterium]